MIAGILPMRIDEDNSDFWLSYQDEVLPPETRYQFKQQELENVAFCS